MKKETLFTELKNRYISSISNDELQELLIPKIDQVITHDELSTALQKKKLKIKFGIDPTGPDIHLGHLLPIMILRLFQRAGHVIHFIIGDFTARIGDPSGRTSERSLLSEKDVLKNKKTYLSQIKPFINIRKATIHHNRKWLKKYSFETILSDLQHVSISEVLQRDDFRKRIEGGSPLSIAELLYAYAQGVDSLKIKPDIEVGGRDQLLNFAQARDLMKQHNIKPEVALTTPVLEGIHGDGKKMSKSLGNYIPLSASSHDIFGKILSIPDTLILPYLLAFADIKNSEVGEMKKYIETDPLEMKKVLAMFLVFILTQSEEEAEKQRAQFEKTFSQHDFSDLETHTLKSSTTVIEFVQSQSLPLSNSELRRIAEEGGIRIIEPSEITLSVHDPIPQGILRIGKKYFFKIKH